MGFEENQGQGTNVLFCVTTVETGKGGIATLNRAYLRAFSELETNHQKINFTVLSLNPITPSTHEWLLSLGMQGKSAKGSAFRLGIHLLLELFRQRPRLVLFDHIDLSQLGPIARLAARTPYGVFCHGIEFRSGLTLWKRLAFKGAQLRIANSEFTRELVSRKIKNKGVEVCYPGIPEPQIPLKRKSQLMFRDALGKPTKVGKKSILIVGRLDPRERYKGHRELIEALTFVRKNAKDVQLIVAGEGLDSLFLKNFAIERRMGESVLFTGYVTEDTLFQLYETCSFFAMPSRNEGFGLVYVEAMAHGKAVLASTVDAAKEVLDDRRTGILSDLHPQKLGLAISELLHSPQKRSKMGKAGRQRFEQIFSINGLTERVEKLLAPHLPGSVRRKRRSTSRRKAS